MPKVTKNQRRNFIIQIHKFTFKVHTININLNFEYIKIVGFNFNSIVSRDVFSKPKWMFLNQEERQEFLISSVSENDWKPAHRLECTMASNNVSFIPSANDFFKGFAAVRGHLEEYQCTLRVIFRTSILAISTQWNPNASLRPWICSCLISYLIIS